MKAELKIVIGQRIKEIRERSKLTQMKLAEQANLSVSYISHIERGKKSASVETLVNIANELGVTVNEFLYGIQVNDNIVYQTDMDILLGECTAIQKQIVYQVVKVLIESLQKQQLTLK